ncbi:MAG: hypothetical protein ABUT39_29235 [Acidobacteriota bacterium]
MRRFIFPAIAVAFVNLIASNEARAIPFYTGSVVGECVEYQGTTYNVKAAVTAPLWTLQGLIYTFTPTPAKVTSVDVDDRNRYFSVTPGAYQVKVGNPEIQGTYSINAPDCSPPRKGMTWRLTSTNSPTGTIHVGCGNNECDPRQGDTDCTTALPILCIKKSGTGFPLPVPATVNNSDQYHRWSGGVVGTTGATVPPATLTAANDLCTKQFGADWRVAEFHDGWGWYFQAYGGVGDPSKRFWVHINDQPKGRCWQ